MSKTSCLSLKRTACCFKRTTSDLFGAQKQLLLTLVAHGDILEIGQFLKQVTPSCEENNQKQKGRRSSWRTQGCVRHYLSSLSRYTNKTCLLHPSVCRFGLHTVVEITTRILTRHSGLPHCAASWPSHFWKERRMKEAGGGLTRGTVVTFFHFHEQLGA